MNEQGIRKTTSWFAAAKPGKSNASSKRFDDASGRAIRLATVVHYIGSTGALLVAAPLLPSAFAKAFVTLLFCCCG